MKRYLAICSVLGVLISPLAAYADGPKTAAVWAPTEWAYVVKDKRINVATSDEVSDGCWTSIEASKTAVELEFIRSGYKIDEKAKTILTLGGAGYKLPRTSLCVVAYQATLAVFDLDVIRQEEWQLTAVTTNKILFNGWGVMTNPASESGEKLKQEFTSQAQAILVMQAKQVQMIEDAFSKLDNRDAAEFWLNWLKASK